ncbi:MAG: hypothetical protein ABSH49_22490 [Bryobacteraceae bacterium]|jgi:hypothetical protein
MTPNRLTELENRLRSAVIARRYHEVRRIAPQFCAAARTAIGELRPGDPLRRETVLYVDRTLEWARVMMILARTSLTSELRRFIFLHRYVSSGPPIPPAATTRLEA